MGFEDIQQHKNPMQIIPSETRRPIEGIIGQCFIDWMRKKYGVRGEIPGDPNLPPWEDYIAAKRNLPGSRGIENEIWGDKAIQDFLNLDADPSNRAQRAQKVKDAIHYFANIEVVNMYDNPEAKRTAGQ